MKPNFTPVAMKNAGVELENIITEVLRQPPILEHYVHVSRLYRRIAVGVLLTSGDPADFYRYLFNAGRAFLHFLETAPEQEKLTSQAAAFFDAVACRDHAAERRMAQASPHAARVDREYPEDFFHVSLLMRRFGNGAELSELQPDLLEWQRLAEENPDPRLPVIASILRRDQAGFNRAIGEAVQLMVDENANARDSELLHPDDAGTVCNVSTVVLAWMELAGRSGLIVGPEYPLAPSTARAFHRASFPTEDDWRNPTGFVTLQ